MSRRAHFFTFLSCLVLGSALGFGQTWTKKFTSPPANTNLQQIAFDSTHGVAVLLNSSTGTTWTWNGAANGGNGAWAQQFPANSPIARTQGSMAYDPIRGKVVLFGGNSNNGINSGALGDTWLWDGTNWALAAPATNPQARYGHNMVWDPVHSQIVLFGGQINGSTALNDVWAWNGANWAQLVANGAAGSPPARVNFAMAFDGSGPSCGACRNQILVFGGSYLGTNTASSIFTINNDMWSFDGVSLWIPLIPTTQQNNGGAYPSFPTARQNVSMVYDSVHNQVVLFGGQAAKNNPYSYTSSLQTGSTSDAWVWTGNWAWLGGNNGVVDCVANAGPPVVLTSPCTNQLASAPTTRQSNPMVWDSANNQIVVYGGSGGGQMNDLFTWDGAAAQWTQKTPNARFYASMVYDPTLGQMVLSTGSNNSRYFSDFFGWSGANWAPLSTAGNSPGGKQGAALAYDSKNDAVVQWAGLTSSGTNSTFYTWSGSPRAWTSNTPKNIPSSGSPTKPKGNYGWAFYPNSNVPGTVMFGGSDNGSPGTVYGDTWVYNLAKTGSIAATTFGLATTPSGAPSARTGTALVWDAKNQQLVLFGGACPAGAIPTVGGTGGAACSGTDYADTWVGTYTWDNTNSKNQPSFTWTQKSPGTSPPARAFHSMAFDCARGKVVMTGGMQSGEVGGVATGNPLFFNDQWTWDGNIWTKETPATGPIPRVGMSMAFNGAINNGTGACTSGTQMMLFGGDYLPFGTTSHQFVNDTWLWDSSPSTGSVTVSTPFTIQTATQSGSTVNVVANQVQTVPGNPAPKLYSCTTADAGNVGPGIANPATLEAPVPCPPTTAVAPGAGLNPGYYTAYYPAVTNYWAPGATAINTAGDQTLMLDSAGSINFSGYYTPQQGSITLNAFDKLANNAPLDAGYTISGPSGYSNPNPPTGTPSTTGTPTQAQVTKLNNWGAYTVTFQPITGYTTPAPQVVNIDPINAPSTAWASSATPPVISYFLNGVANGNYVQQPATITVTPVDSNSSPLSGNFSAVGLVNTTPITSNTGTTATVTPPVWDTYTLTFNTIPGYTAPPTQQVITSATNLTPSAVVAAYTPVPGSIVVNAQAQGGGALPTTPTFTIAGANQANPANGQTFTGTAASLTWDTYTITFNSIAGYNAPGQQTVVLSATSPQVSIIANVPTATVTATYQKQANAVTVSTNIANASFTLAGPDPDLPQTVTGGVAPASLVASQAPGVFSYTLNGASPVAGTPYSVTFQNNVPGYMAPSTVTPVPADAILQPNATVTLTGNYVKILGGITVNPTPATATYTITGTSATGYNSGTLSGSKTVSGLDWDTYTVAFNSITGYVTPQNQTVTINAGTVSTPATVTATYQQQPGSITVNTQDPSANSVSAPFTIAGPAGFTTVNGTGPAQTVNNLTIWGTYTITFNALTNYDSPSTVSQQVTIGPTNLAPVVTGTYSPKPGSVTITTNLDSATFTLTPGNLTGSGKSKTFSSLAAGVSYSVSFGDVSGYQTPVVPAQILLANGALSFNGNYQVQSGTITVVTNAPGATFSISQGSTFVSSSNNFTTSPVSAAPGPYTIRYGSVAGYNTPPDATQTLAPNGAMTFTGSYVLPTLSVSPQSLNFNWQPGQSAPAPQSFSVTTDAGFPVAFTVSTSGEYWLTAVGTGTTPGSTTVWVTIPNVGTAGTYKGSVTITAPGSGNASKTVPVTITTTDPPPLKDFLLSPNSLNMSYQVGGSVPPPQTISVSGPSGEALSVVVQQFLAGAWLSVVPSGSSLRVSVNTAGLTAGIYDGLFIVSAGQGYNQQTVRVRLTVQDPPQLVMTPAILAFSYQTGGALPAPQTVYLTSKGRPVSYSAIPSSTGNWLVVNGGGGSTPVNLSVSANPAGLAPGAYNGSIAVTSADATNSPQTVAVTLTVTAPPPPAPAFSAIAVVNAASATAPVAPGSIVSIYGSNLAKAETRNSVVPLPTMLGGATVNLNGKPIPLFYASPGQINAQIPYEAQSGKATLEVNSGQASGSTSVTIAVTAPGIFMSQGGRAAVHNEDHSVNGSSNPAKTGSVITAYLTGQGAVDGPCTTGNAAPMDRLLNHQAAVTATLGGKPVEISFAGLTPGSVGMSQVNFRVPTLPSGDHALIVTTGGTASNSAVVTIAAN